MLTAFVPPALPGLPRHLPADPARRQDSSGSSGSYHTAPGSPETPDAGPDAGWTDWPRVAPGRGAGEQSRLSVSAQNSRQQPWSGSGFPRGPGSGPPPPQPQLRVLPSGEMEVIFTAGPLFSRSDVEDREVQQLTAQPLSTSLPLSTSPLKTASPVPAPPRPPAPDGGSRWATYLELRPSGPSPAAPTQFECVEVPLEERTAPVRARTVPKRQIELRPRPQSPPRQACTPRPRLLLRTGSLDESLSRLQVAAGLVQTALARKLVPETPAASSATGRPTERPEPQTGDTARSARSWPPRTQESSGPARAPRPWPSLRERAIRRDKPAPGTEPLGPVSSSIFLQSEEKIQEARKQRPKTRLPQETPGQIARREPSLALESRVPREAPSRAEKPKSQSSPGQAPNGAARDPRSPSPQNLTSWNQDVRRVSSPPFCETSSTWESRYPAVVEHNSRSPSPSTPSQWNQGGARAKSPSPEVPSQWEVPPLAVRCNNLSLCSRDAPARPIATPSPSPQETWGPSVQGSSLAFRREVMNGVAPELAPPRPPTPRTPKLTEVPSVPSKENPDLDFRGSQPSPEADASEPLRSHLGGALEADARPAVLGSGEAVSERPRVAIPRPRDVRKMMKTTYAPSFSAGSPSSGKPAPPTDSCREDGLSLLTREFQALGSPAPAHYTSVFLKDFLPVVPHPYEPPEPAFDTVPRDAPQPNGVLRRRAENSTAKPFARTEIRLPGALALGRRPDRAPGVLARGTPENAAAESSRLAGEGEGRTSPPGGARSSPQPAPRAPPPPQPPRAPSPQARPNSSPGKASSLETPALAPEPAAAPQGPLPGEPRAASAPPTDRFKQGHSQGPRRPPGATPPGRVLVDPESGRYYFVEAQRQPRLRLLFDPESGQYVEVLLPPASPGLPRHIYAPLAMGTGLYPSAYGPMPGLALPPSPGPPALSSPQLPWASETGPLDGLYYLPVSGTPSPGPPLLLCASSSSSGPPPPGKGSVVPL